MTIVCIIIIAIGVGFFCGYLKYHKQIIATQKLDSDIAAKNSQLLQDKLVLEGQNSQLTQEKNNLEERKIQLLNEKKDLEKEKSDLFLSISQLQEQAKQSGQEFLNQELEIAKNRIEKATQVLEEKYQKTEEQLEENYQHAREDYQEEYLDLLEQYSQDFLLLEISKKQELEHLNNKISEYQAKANAAAEAAKREEEKQTNINFYRCVLTPIDIEEIKNIRSISHLLRDPEPINKVIWKVYYEKAYTDLVGRVVGSGRHCGIYKITNIENQKCYVGQARDISERWRQHIKRGIGAETPTRNKLYPAMQECGVENFTFEILEECDSNLLDSREDYWQDFYKAKEYGYSIK